MEKNYKTIPFDIKKAKTPENPDGLEVVTKDGRSVRIVCINKRGCNPIVALIDENTSEDCILYKLNGTISCGLNSYDLVLKEPIKQRRMTNQELSWWLRECPEEHREYKFKTNPIIYHDYIYKDGDVNEVIDDHILIRSNGEEWSEPLIEIE